jgi:hypothetical protein
MLLFDSNFTVHLQLITVIDTVCSKFTVHLKLVLLCVCKFTVHLQLTKLCATSSQYT